MSSRLQLDVHNLSLGRRHLMNEVKAGIGVIAGNTVIHAWVAWVWGTPKSALYKYTYLYLLSPRAGKDLSCKYIMVAQLPHTSLIERDEK